MSGFAVSAGEREGQTKGKFFCVFSVVIKDTAITINGGALYLQEVVVIAHDHRKPAFANETDIEKFAFPIARHHTWLADL